MAISVYRSLSLFLVLFIVLTKKTTIKLIQDPIFLLLTLPKPLNIEPYSRTLQGLIKNTNLVLNSFNKKPTSKLVPEPIKDSVQHRNRFQKYEANQNNS